MARLDGVDMPKGNHGRNKRIPQASSGHDPATKETEKFFATQAKRSVDR